MVSELQDLLSKASQEESKIQKNPVYGLKTCMVSMNSLPLESPERADLTVTKRQLMAHLSCSEEAAELLFVQSQLDQHAEDEPLKKKMRKLKRVLSLSGEKELDEKSWSSAPVSVNSASLSSFSPSSSAGLPAIPSSLSQGAAADRDVSFA
eukprot:5545478-Karenia_brevis.AAC.1